MHKLQKIINCLFYFLLAFTIPNGFGPNQFKFVSSLMKKITTHILNLTFHIQKFFIIVSYWLVISLLVTYSLTNADSGSSINISHNFCKMKMAMQSYCMCSWCGERNRCQLSTSLRCVIYWCSIILQKLHRQNVKFRMCVAICYLYTW